METVASSMVQRGFIPRARAKSVVWQSSLLWEKCIRRGRLPATYSCCFAAPAGGYLGKANPHVEFRTDQVGISVEGSQVIRNAFGHVLRNSMDHGLETSETRLSHGKPEQGTIRVDISVAADGSLRIVYADDAAGLNLSKIHQRGLANNLIKPDELHPQKVAELIFNSGLSTARQVTDISGRGVGMGAVREFFEQIGGRVDLRLINELNSLDSTAFEVVMILPKGFFAKRNKDFSVGHPIQASA